MSGIFGIFQRDGQPVTLAQLQQQQTAMAPWAVDGSQLWCEGAIGFGCQWHITTPEAQREQLPATSPSCPGLTITADARLDNRAELTAALAIPAVIAKGLPDSELILQAYARWGDACPRFLVGAFAFVIWDAAKQQLFCARDHIGFRPFYYYLSSRCFVFASDMKALLAVEGVPYRLDHHQVLAAHFLGAHHLRARTLLHDIAKLPPATWLALERATQRQGCYWQPSRGEPLRLPSLDAYAEQLRAQLEQAVGSCLRSNHPVGAHVSGGLDSSGVAVLAARALRATGRALAAFFSWSPPPLPGTAPSQDERARIAALAAQEEVPCYYVELTATDVTELLARDIRTEPTVPLFCEPVVQRMAQAQGIRVLLSGWGGDDVVTYTGDGHWAALFRRGRWRQLWQAIHGHRQATGASARSLLTTQLLLPLLPGPLYRWHARRVIQHQLPTLAPPLHRHLVHNSAPLRIHPSVWANQRARLQHGHLTQRLEAWAAPYAGQLFDYRYPLLDRRLLDFCLRLPPELYWQQGRRRYLFRYALRDLLPATICWHPSKADPAQAAMVKQVVALGIAHYQAQQAAASDQQGIACLHMT